MSQLQLRDYIAALRKYWWVILLTTVVAAGAAYGLTLTQTPMYQSQISLLAIKNQGDVDLTQELNSYPDQLTSRDFLQQVINNAQMEISPDALKGAMNVQAQPTKGIVYVSVDDKDAATAQLLANAIGDAFVEQKASEVGAGGLQRVIIEKLGRAPLPDKPYKPSKTINTAAGAALGLVLGVLLAIGLALLDDTLKNNEDVERYLGLSTLGAIPKL